ncbi:hypothetical protein D6833_13830 [Candidatus Parcubacteria bacterium]|nr:MAG: hypothetical protein D6833_13830 [Candidatus Parcubacteria bacterium]
MRVSFYCACVEIPQSDRCLLFQTLRGAIDVVPKDVARALEQFGGSGSTPLSEAEIETLKQRGYLTEPAAEREQARAVLRLAANHLQRFLEIVLRFPPDMKESSPPASNSGQLDQVFSLAARAAGDGRLLTARLEITSPEVSPRIMERVLETAMERDCPVFPHVTIAGLDALRPWLKSEYFPQVVLTTDSAANLLDVEALASTITRFFEHQVPVLWRCQVDGMSTEQLGAVHLIRERVRQKYASFMLYLFSDTSEGTSAPTPINIHEAWLPTISSENEVILTTLMRFIVTPARVNYNPFFQPDADKLIFDLDTRHLSYRSSADDRLVDGVDDVSAHIEAELAQKPADFWQAVKQSSECPSCKYALVCGRNWIGEYGYATAERCARAFGQRLKQSLPLVFYNLRGNWRPPNAGPAESQKEATKEDVVHAGQS